MLQVVRQLAKALLVLVVGDHYAGMDNAWDIAAKREDEAEEKAPQAPGQQHRHGRKQDSKEEEHDAGTLDVSRRSACNPR